MYKHFFKRLFDIIISFFSIALLLVPLVIIAILIKIDSKGPIIFKQYRLGRNGKVYKMYKFRTMCVDAEKDGVYSNDSDKRITKIGHFLRKTSLDELPQFFNVLKGDCSLIGFRSPLTYHPWTWDEYTEEQKKMFDLRPGITGWAQVNGRRTVEWNERIKMNIWYAENCNFLLDLKIVFLTLIKVFKNSDNENIGETVKKNQSINTFSVDNETLNK